MKILNPLVRSKGSALLFVIVGTVVVLLGAWVLKQKGITFNLHPRASSSTQTITGTLLLSSNPICSKSDSGPNGPRVTTVRPKTTYSILVGPAILGVRGGPSGGLTCTLVVVNDSQAKPLLNKAVIATGVTKDGIFYASEIKLVSDSGGGNRGTFPPEPSPKLITCGGIRGQVCPTGFECIYDSSFPDASGVCKPTPPKCLTQGSVCDPKVTTKSGKCCSNLACDLGKSKNGTYTCVTPKIYAQ